MPRCFRELAKDSRTCRPVVVSAEPDEAEADADVERIRTERLADGHPSLAGDGGEDEVEVKYAESPEDGGDEDARDGDG